MILLDTNVLSELVRQRPERRVVDWVDSRERGDLSVTAITIMELRFGIEVMPAGIAGAPSKPKFANSLK